MNGWLERQIEKRQLAEMRLLGTAMARPDLADMIVARCDWQQFGSDANRLVGWAVWTLRRDGKPCGLEEVTDRLIGQGKLDEVGNAAGLFQLLTMAEDDTRSLDEFLDIMRRRRVYRACEGGMQRAMNPDLSPDDAAAQVLADLNDPVEVSDTDPIWTDELLAMDPPQWLVEGIIPEGLTVLFGSPKTGKSYVALTLAWALATGTSWFRLPTGPKRRVLYLAGEGVGDLRLRADSLLTEVGRHPGGDLQFWPNILHLSRESDAARLRLMVEKAEAELVIVDTWARYAGVRDENDAAQVQASVNALESLTRRGTSVLVVHHTSKAGTMRGSSALAGAVEAAIQLQHSETEPKVKMSSSLSRRGAGFDDILLEWKRVGKDSVMQRCG